MAVTWKQIRSLPIAPVPSPYTFIQDCVFVAGNGGKPPVWIIAQDAHVGTRFLLFDDKNQFTGQEMTVLKGGHGSAFHAYRSAAGNLYIWTDVKDGAEAHRIKWQPGKRVTAGTRMDYKGGQPCSAPEPYIGFRTTSSAKGTDHFSVHNRVGFTDGPGHVSAAPIREVTIPHSKRPQQTFSVTKDRIYRFTGATNSNPGHGSMLHVLEVFTWPGKHLGDFDLTHMTVPTTSDEPEGLTMRNGKVVAGKRVGSSHAQRKYVLWELDGLP